MKAILKKDIHEGFRENAKLIPKGTELTLGIFEGCPAWMLGDFWICDPDSEMANDFVEVIE